MQNWGGASTPCSRVVEGRRVALKSTVARGQLTAFAHGLPVVNMLYGPNLLTCIHTLKAYTGELLVEFLPIGPIQFLGVQIEWSVRQWE